VICLIVSKVDHDFSRDVSSVFVNISVPIAKFAAFPFNAAFSLVTDFGELVRAKEENKNLVIQTINAATQFNLKSTPTIIVNGRKIEGTIPSAQFFAIFEDILKAKNK
jgi:thioredoxin-related protein